MRSEELIQLSRIARAVVPPSVTQPVVEVQLGQTIGSGIPVTVAETQKLT